MSRLCDCTLNTLLVCGCCLSPNFRPSPDYLQPVEADYCSCDGRRLDAAASLAVGLDFHWSGMGQIMLVDPSFALEVVSWVTKSAVPQVLRAIWAHRVLRSCGVHAVSSWRPRSPPQIQAEILPTTLARCVELTGVGFPQSRRHPWAPTRTSFGPQAFPWCAAQVCWRYHPPQRSTHEATLQCPGAQMGCCSLACTAVQPALVSIKQGQPRDTTARRLDCI